MTKGPLYAIGALFNTPEKIIRAASETAQAGYTKYDVNTPYPVHGMDGAMRLRPSRLGFFAFAFGLLGTVSAVGLMTWVTLVDYPMVIGGKPFWSWPAFVPIAFELTVLLASVLSVVAMIVIYFKFPNNRHPLHDTTYMRRVSSDMFGLYVKADDPAFVERTVRDHFTRLGAAEIEPIHYFLPDEAERPKLFEPKFLAVLAVTALVTMAATYVTYNKILYMVPYSWMSDQAKLRRRSPRTSSRTGSECVRLWKERWQGDSFPTPSRGSRIPRGGFS